MLRQLLLMLTLGVATTLTLSHARGDAKSDAAKTKKALQDLGEFIGQWNLTGETKSSGKLQSWKETANWVWKFQGDAVSIAFDNKDSRYFTSGSLTYLPIDKKYQLTLADKDKKEQVFLGTFARGKLTFERTDDKTKDVHRLTMNTLSEGVRLSVAYDVQSGGKGLFGNVYKSVGNKEGESLAGGNTKKAPECVVTGGAAKIPVTYMGKTYYVCCSGCADEFNANPKKYVK
jgi:YHS domain-containing protein